MAKKRASWIVGPYHKEIEIDQKTLFYKKKFYSDAKDFSYFKDTKQNIAPKFKKIIESKFLESDYPYNSYKRYIAVLEYLIASKNQKEFNSFDEKIIFLIEAIDPNLSIYFFYLRVGYSPFASKEDKSQKEKALIDYITSIVGTSDPQFLKYEEAYLQRFLKSEDIISFVNSDYSSRFITLFTLNPTFENINDMEYRYISRKVDFFRANCGDANNLNTICYNLRNPNSTLEIFHPLHQIIFFIMAVDPELKALTIYAEESNIESIKARMLQELGFFHENFIKIEKEYRKRFCPDKKVSTWSL